MMEFCFQIILDNSPGRQAETKREWDGKHFIPAGEEEVLATPMLSIRSNV